MSNETQQQQGLEALVDMIADRAAKIVLDGVMPLIKQTRADELITRKQAMEILHVTEATLWRWEKLGILKRHGNLGTRIYYSRDDVEKAMENGNKH